MYPNSGFVIVLKDLSDTKIDVPDAVESVAKFLARAVADDCLYPVFIEKHPCTICTLSYYLLSHSHYPSSARRRS